MGTRYLEWVYTRNARKGITLKIEIGSGEYPRLIEEGYLHSDIRYPLPHQEIAFRLEHLPFKENSFDNIALMHSLGYVYWRNIEATIAELYGLLKDNGSLVVAWPNLLWIAERIGEMPEGNEEEAERQMYEVIFPHLYTTNTYNGHGILTSFTPEFIAKLFKNVGFSRIEMPNKRLDQFIAIWGYK
jgi:SAM-dependent methyltransferase